MSGTKDGAAAGAAAVTGAAADGVALVVAVWANNGVPIAKAISERKIFMPKVL